MEDFEPRYVDVPRRRRANQAAARNLMWGLALLLLALGLAGAALIISGPRALLPLFICLVTFLVLWVLARLRVFHERNGVFFATAMICLVGALIPMVEKAYVELDRMVNGPASEHSAPRNASDEAALALVDDQPLPASKAEPAPAAQPEPDPEPEPPSLVETFKIKAPSDPTQNVVRVVQDTNVTVGRKVYLLHAGETYPLEEIKADSVVFRANELRLSVPDVAVEVMQGKPAQPRVADTIPPQPAAAATKPPAVSDQENPAVVTARAQEEAIRRYPAIGQKDSPENQLFLQRVRELRTERPEFFEDPGWPVYLADALAREQRWTRPDQGPVAPPEIPEPSGPSQPAEPAGTPAVVEPGEAPAQP